MFGSFRSKPQGTPHHIGEGPRKTNTPMSQGPSFGRRQPAAEGFHSNGCRKCNVPKVKRLKHQQPVIYEFTRPAPRLGSKPISAPDLPGLVLSLYPPQTAASLRGEWDVIHTMQQTSGSCMAEAFFNPQTLRSAALALGRPAVA